MLNVRGGRKPPSFFVLGGHFRRQRGPAHHIITPGMLAGREEYLPSRMLIPRFVPTLLVATLALLSSLEGHAKGYTLRQLFATPDSVVLELTVDEYTLAPHPVGGVIPRIEGALTVSQPTEPELPNITIAYRPSAPQGLRVHLLDSQITPLGQHELVPAVARTRSEANVAKPRLRGLAYMQEGDFPNSPYHLGPVARSGAAYRQSLALSPFAWQAQSRSLKLYKGLRLAVAGIAPEVAPTPATRGATGGAKPYPHGSADYMLIVVAKRFEGEMADYVRFKNSLGLRTKTLVYYDSSASKPTGVRSQAELQARIRELYQEDEGLKYVLLVGSPRDIPPIRLKGTLYESKQRMVDCDQPYGWLRGDDAYPELLVGRYSAYTSAQLRTQLHRAMNYEAGRLLHPPAYGNALSIASVAPGGGDNGESDIEHQDVIVELLGQHGYKLFRAYDPSASSFYIGDVLNYGVGLVNYSGHGLDSLWSSGRFGNKDVRALRNSGAYPFVLSVACLNGDTRIEGCFAEQWLWAGTPAQPLGAVAFLGSSDDLPWNPPMLAQDTFAELLVEVDPERKLHTLGELLARAFSVMLDKYGASPTPWGSYPATEGYLSAMAWNLFGDPSLIIRSPRASKSKPISRILVRNEPTPPSPTSWKSSHTDPQTPPRPSEPSKPGSSPSLQRPPSLTGKLASPTVLPGPTRLYPNPFGSSLLVTLAEAAGEGYVLRLYSPAGQLLRSVPVRAGEATVRMEMGDLPAGMYILRGAGWVRSVVKR